MTTRPFVRGGNGPGLAGTLDAEHLEVSSRTHPGRRTFTSQRRRPPKEGPFRFPHLDDRAYLTVRREFKVALSLRAAVVKTLDDAQLALPTRSEASGRLWRGSRCDETFYMASSKAAPCACGLATLEVTTAADGPWRVEKVVSPCRVGGSKARRKQFATLKPREDGRSLHPS